VRRFIATEVLPKAAEAEDRLSYGEVQAFKTIDRILSAVVLEEAALRVEAAVEMLQTAAQPTGQLAGQPAEQPAAQATAQSTAEPLVAPAAEPPAMPAQAAAQPPAAQPPEAQLREQLLQSLQPEPPQPAQVLSQLPIKPKLPPRKVSLRLGYQVIPYASEEDDREYFVDGKTIFVNKKHPAYVKSSAEAGTSSSGTCYASWQAFWPPKSVLSRLRPLRRRTGS